MNPLLGRGFTRNIKPYFLRKIKVKKLLQFLLGALGFKRYFENNIPLKPVLRGWTFHFIAGTCNERIHLNRICLKFLVTFKNCLIYAKVTGAADSCS